MNGLARSGDVERAALSIRTCMQGQKEYALAHAPLNQSTHGINPKAAGNLLQAGHVLFPESGKEVGDMPDRTRDVLAVDVQADHLSALFPERVPVAKRLGLFQGTEGHRGFP